jgi:hypothetical protein
MTSVLPTAEVSAARPVCTTSKKAYITRPASLWKDARMQFWVRACVQNGVLVVEARQRNVGRLVCGEPSIESELRIMIHGTNSQGRFLQDIKFDKTEWLGDIVPRFSRDSKGGCEREAYAMSARLLEMELPEFPAGTYFLGVELRIDSSADKESWQTTGMRYLKYRIR